MNLWDYEARALWHDNPLLWDYRVRILRQEAAEAGDAAQVLLCDHALGDRNPTLEQMNVAQSLCLKTLLETQEMAGGN